jgi:hypothetical protein
LRTSQQIKLIYIILAILEIKVVEKFYPIVSSVWCNATCPVSSGNLHSALRREKN